MDGSSKGIGGGGAGADKPSPDHDQNASPNVPAAAAAGDDGASAAAAAAAAAAEGRRPFTSLSQEEADLALARVLQEQERAYMMLTAQYGGGEYASSDAGSYDYDEDEGSDYEDEEGGGDPIDEDEAVAGAEGAAADPAAGYEDDEAFARALQDAEERDVAGRLMALAGIGDWRAMEQEDDEEVEEEADGDDPQDAWEDVDPDEYSYEELIALGEAVGTESKGLSAHTIASLPSVTYQAQEKQEGNMEQCVVCRVEFDEGETLVALPCKHPYHSECINQWLQLNKGNKGNGRVCLPVFFSSIEQM
ncbi:E3 ubiquitin ligase BIG BROTHER-related-like isoform X2 [Panicum miliaceum]|uniref:E3 ubiquitin ligase BIG BROTHER-related-like isoform X2 n=1 Tax=Panicum miliaceum TaxID=4540 RepID=A0A3L6RM43_PANMI|nr:E3 ubiquitin ligase BIG BROTHER-related-like isoform X2 [Panicum miliaceum]